jgi:nicotinamidase-related amidase
MKLNPEKSALVLIEFQNDFTSEGGTLHAAVKGVMNQNNMLEKSVELVKACRNKGYKIIHVPISFAAGYPELNPGIYGILKGVIDSQSFKKGSWGAEIAECMSPAKEDIIIEGKRGLCGFSSTNLDFILRSRGVENIILAGFLTNCCVESTMRTAYEKGYKVITITDCCATTSEEEQKIATTKDFTMFSLPKTQEEFLKSI